MKRSSLELRRRSRVLFPQCTRHMRAQWVLARIRVDGGTWKFPIGARHVESPDVPLFLRRLPPGPPLEIVDSAFDKRRKAFRFVKALTR
jgi:hypothetical protein